MRKDETLKAKTAAAIAWNFVDRFGQQLLLFAVGIIVANKLDVQDYALVGMLAIFTTLGNILIESGFSAALIQKKEADDKDYSTVFWFNIAMSIAIYLLLLALSPLIAAFFGEPRLVGLSAVVFLNIPLNATVIIQIAMQTKQVRFRQLAKANILSMAVAGLAALALAFAGMGVWTLVLQPLLQVCIRSILLWRGNPWMPQRFFSLRILKSFSGYSFNLMLSSLLNTCFNNVYSLVIPKLFHARQLGLLTQANKISDPVSALLHGSLQNASFPIFSNIQDQPERLLNAYRKTIRFSAFLTFPLLIGLAVIAPSVYRLLFKQEWWEAIPYFQLLCIGGCAMVMTSVNNNIIKVSGRSRGIFITELIKVVLAVIAVAASWHFGVLWLVASIIAVRYIVYVIYMYYAQRQSSYSMWQQLLDTLPYLLIALLSAIPAWMVSRVVTNDFLLLPLQLLTGGLLYFGITWLSGSKILKESVAFILRKA